MIATHDVLNQPPPFEDVDLFGADLALAEGLEREGAGWAVDRVRDCGLAAGSAEAQEHGRRAERNAPRLRTHDRFGHRIDEVDYDPSWHWLLRGAVEREIHALPWRSPRPGAHVARAALELLWTQAERGRDVPGLDDLLGRARAAGRSRARRRVGAAAHARPTTSAARCAGWR